jgi:hypothetical protein
VDREGLFVACRLLEAALGKIWPSYNFRVESSLLSKRVKVHTTSRILIENYHEGIGDVASLLFEVIIHPSRLKLEHIEDTLEDIITKVLERVTLIESVED